MITAMRILCCLNRDLASNLALNLLLPALAHHTVRVVLTERVGSLRTDEPRQRRELRIAEQALPNGALFPLVERAALPDNGRRHLTFTEISRARGIPVDPLSDPNGEAGLQFVRAFAPDLIVTIRYGAILKAPVIAVPGYGVLNLHSGILPAYRGVLATFRAMLAGEAHIGCTLHYIRDPSIDTGDIVGIRLIPLQRDESLLRNTLAVYPAGIQMLCAALETLQQGRPLPSTIQHPGEGTYYSYPTQQEWDEFTRRGWRVADPSDLERIMSKYMEV